MFKSLYQLLILCMAIFEAIAPKRAPNAVKATAVTKDQFLFLTTRRCRRELQDGTVKVAPEANTPIEWIEAYREHVVPNLNDPHIPKNDQANDKNKEDKLRTFMNEPQKMHNDKLPNKSPLPLIDDDDSNKILYKEAPGAQYRLQANNIKRIRGKKKKSHDVINPDRIGDYDRNRFVLRYEGKDGQWSVTDIWLSFDHYETFYKLEKEALKCIQGQDKCMNKIRQENIKKWQERDDKNFPPAVPPKNQKKARAEYGNELHTLYRLSSGYEDALRSYNEHLKALEYSKAKLEHIGNELNEFYYYQGYDQYFDDQEY